MPSASAVPLAVTPFSSCQTRAARVAVKTIRRVRQHLGRAALDDQPQVGDDQHRAGRESPVDGLHGVHTDWHASEVDIVVILFPEQALDSAHHVGSGQRRQHGLAEVGDRGEHGLRVEDALERESRATGWRAVLDGDVAVRKLDARVQTHAARLRAHEAERGGTQAQDDGQQDGRAFHRVLPFEQWIYLHDMAVHECFLGDFRYVRISSLESREYRT